ncbi:MAG: hypothetical protein ACRCW2_06850 [Cellulosilyticaceae bacterium]
MTKFCKGSLVFISSFSTMLLTLLLFPYDGPQKIPVTKYKQYDHYGLQYADIENECLDFLANTLDQALITLTHEADDYKVFMLEDLGAPSATQIKSRLPLCQEITAIRATFFDAPLESIGPYQFDITYLPHDGGNEVSLSYRSDGSCTKSFIRDNQVVELSGLWSSPKSIDAQINYRSIED